MVLAVIGTGYVGLVTGACLADAGHTVTCVDTDRSKIAQLRIGEVPFHEPGLDRVVQRGVQSGRLRFSCDGSKSVAGCSIVMLAVGTPCTQDGAADLSMLRAAVLELAAGLEPGTVVVNKSTAPIGTCDRIHTWIARHSKVAFSVASNPEFLREGSAIRDFQRPDRVVVGACDAIAVTRLRELYEEFTDSDRPLLVVPPRDAEMIKYAANGLLAARLSLINEIANICKATGATIEAVRRGVGFDTRIGFDFLRPGCGCGGSCFPKDVRALIHIARECGLPAKMLTATHEVNEAQKRLPVEMLSTCFEQGVSGKTIAIWGTAFKENTDDIRESPGVAAVEALLAAGATIVAHDPKAASRTSLRFGDRITQRGDPVACAQNADALLILTPWDCYSNELAQRAAQHMRRALIIDGRNALDPIVMADSGIEYHSIGRPTVLRSQLDEPIDAAAA